jgi:hypothetical protein
MSAGDAKWRALAKWLRIAGGVWCFALLLSHVALLAYYGADRPQQPQPEKGLTTGLMWTHPTRYGTKEDERRSQWLFEWCFAGLGPFVLGELIRVYKLNDYSGVRSRENPPWNHRWGP